MLKVTVIDAPEIRNDYGIEIVVTRYNLITFLISLLIVYHERKKIKNHLTIREEEILEYIAEGKNNGEIAEKLNISVHTVKMYVKKIFEKLNVTDRTQAAIKAVKCGLIAVI